MTSASHSLPTSTWKLFDFNFPISFTPIPMLAPFGSDWVEFREALSSDTGVVLHHGPNYSCRIIAVAWH